MFDIPKFSVGDKVRLTRKEIELFCSNCDFNGSLTGNVGDILTIIAVGKPEGTIECRKCGTVLTSREGWYAVSINPISGKVDAVPYTCIELAKEVVLTCLKERDA